MVAATQNIVIAAGQSGKVKTASQMISIVTILILLSINQCFGVSIPVAMISNILMWATGAIAVYSGAEYIIRNRSLLQMH